MTTTRVEAALATAHRARAEALSGTRSSSRPEADAPIAAARRWYVMGDPQAPARRVMEVLDAHRALGEDGRLAADVGLVSMGDHFDFKEPIGKTLADVARDGEAIFAWLTAHPPDRAVVLLGNHDLSRVMELARVSDEAFAEARSLGIAIRDCRVDADASVLQARFAARFPDVPTPGLAARDYAAFTEAQRALVERALLEDRARLACAVELEGGVTAIATHAGVTTRELGWLGAVDERDPVAIARALDDRLRRAVDEVRDRWRAGQSAVLDLSPLHERGAEGREGGGLLYHRPAHPDRDRDRPRPSARARRRFPPAELAAGVVQIAGHIDHPKCLEELAGYDRSAAMELPAGALRELRVERKGVTYAPLRLPVEPVAPDEARLVLCDGGMNRVPRAEDYALLSIRGVRP